MVHQGLLKGLLQAVFEVTKRAPVTKGRASGEGSVGCHPKSPGSDLGTQAEVKEPFCS